MALAKGLGGGFPIGACLATETAAKFMTPGTHGSTFGGNPLAMAVGNAVLDVVLEPGMLDRVRAVAEHLWSKLQEVVTRRARVFEGLRGQGLMIGLKCKVPNTEVVGGLFENGLLVVSAGDNVVRLVPPLIIGEGEINAAAAIIDKTAAALERRA
jgi:acetylornithine/N-succinyldiaminopimelate aminotransferase